jgi:uncharacterized membrane protein affecting hemolysin expression
MIAVYFVRNGLKIRVDVNEGSTLMEAAKYYSKININELELIVVVVVPVVLATLLLMKDG